MYIKKINEDHFALNNMLGTAHWPIHMFELNYTVAYYHDLYLHKPLRLIYLHADGYRKIT